ncbi:MAG: hypothetical protein JO058_13985 [Alphaproteobacteria bacterium]|nr:hypothetical protein [Alphaproteobacteria bacterium]
MDEQAVMSAARLCAALILITTTSTASVADDGDRDRDGGGDRISSSVVQQGFQISPVPFNKLNLAGKDRALVALGSYLVNGVGDCNGCHTFPRFLRPGGTPSTTTNSTGNLQSLGSNPKYGNPYLDPPDQPLNGQLQANVNADTTHGVVIHTPAGTSIYQYNHFLAGGRCFGFFMSRNITPDDSGKPRGLTEAEFIQVMRQGKDVSCSKQNPPIYGGVPDPVCSNPEGKGAGTSFNPGVLQTMSWATFHSMTDTDLKAIYAYLSALPQSKACNTGGPAGNGCAGFFGDAQGAGEVGTNRYRYANTDDCPNNLVNGLGQPNIGDDHLPYGVSPPQ